MDYRLRLYKLWAPDDASWTQWCKPVVFMKISPKVIMQKRDYFSTLKSFKLPEYQNNRVVIVDLAGEKSVMEGLAFAQKGYRPVPLFNGVPGPKKAVVSMDKIVNWLCFGRQMLPKLKLSPTANPVFLLDALRLQGKKFAEGTFDNRWCVVKQDLPSANYFKTHNITEIVVRTNELLPDLRHILAYYQKEGLTIYQCDARGNLRKIERIKDNRTHWFFRFLLLLGFARSSSGGFGISYQEVSSGGGVHRIG